MSIRKLVFLIAILALAIPTVSAQDGSVVPPPNPPLSHSGRNTSKSDPSIFPTRVGRYDKELKERNDSEFNNIIARSAARSAAAPPGQRAGGLAGVVVVAFAASDGEISWYALGAIVLAAVLLQMAFSKESPSAPSISSDGEIAAVATAEAKRSEALVVPVQEPRRPFWKMLLLASTPVLLVAVFCVGLALYAVLWRGP